MKKSKIVIATGGTGGHLFPAIQLAKQLRAKNAKVVLAGNQNRFANKIKDSFVNITSSSIRKKNFPIASLKILYGFIQSVFFIKKFKPTLLIGFGSFYSFPILLAAKMMRIPYLIYEPNSVCGLVNRIFSKKALALTVQFQEIKKHKSHNVVATSFLPWKPLKKINKASVIKKLGLNLENFTLLVFGGSQGALFLNNLLLRSLKNLQENNIQVIHVTGSSSTSKVLKKKYHMHQIKSYVVPFFEDISELCFAADLAICRSGAGTIGDLIQTSTPSILVPYPYATDDHQYFNAKILQDKIKGGYVIRQSNLSVEKFFQVITTLQNNNCSKLHQMSQNLSKYYKKESETRKSLIQIVEDLC